MLQILIYYTMLSIFAMIEVLLRRRKLVFDTICSAHPCRADLNTAAPNSNMRTRKRALTESTAMQWLLRVCRQCVDH